MSALVLALVLVAAPERLEGLPPLGGKAPPVTPLKVEHRIEVPRSEGCSAFEHRGFVGRSVELWGARCFGAQAWGFGRAGQAVVIPLHRQSQAGAPSWLAADRSHLSELVSLEKLPEWLPRLAAERAEPAAPGFTLLGTDPRDGSKAGYVRDAVNGYVRLKSPGVSEPVFAARLPQEAQTHASALAFDGDPKVKEPWLAYSPEPTRHAELRLRAPDGKEEVLLRLPGSETGSCCRVESVQAVQAAAKQRPVVSAKVDGAHVVSSAGVVRALPAWPRLPERPSSGGPPCREDERREATEEHFDPQLFAHQGRAFTVYLQENVRTRLHWGQVPRDGETPAKDRLECDWVTDATEAERLLVLAEVTEDGSLRERLRVPVEAGGYGSRVRLELDGDRLHVMASSMGFVTYATVELARLGP